MALLASANINIMQNPTPVVAKQLFWCKRCLNRLTVACFLEVNFLSSNTIVYFSKPNTRGCKFAVFVAIYLSFACVFCPDFGAFCQK